MPTLDWLGKQAVVEHHKQVPFHLLKCDGKLSVGEADAGNLLIEGDNLLALKALLPHYGGQVKCVYIDPPYNTGNENWIYNDNVNAPQIREWLGKVVGGEGEDLSRHDKWLCMMYPRVQLLHQLLSEDGAIFVSIDENEMPRLRLLLDEVSGGQNFVGFLIWRKKEGGGQTDAYFVTEHEYVCVYAKNKSQFVWKDETVVRDEREYPLEDANGRYKLMKLEKWGAGARKEDRPTMHFPIESPDKRMVSPKAPDGSAGRWRVGQPTMNRIIEEGRLHWKKEKGEWVAYEKIYHTLGELKTIKARSILHDLATTGEGSDELTQIFGKKDVFPNPKPTALIEFIVRHVCDSDSLVLDSFVGSGTTAHAVMQANKEDGGNRRFILVEMEPNIARGITAERLRRVIEGYKWKDQQGKTRKEEGLGGGFRYCTLGVTLFDADGQIRSEVKFDDLARHVFFVETGEPLPKKASGKTPFIGAAKGISVYLLYNGVLGDKSPQGGNVLTTAVLAALPKHDGAKVVYGNGCRISPERLKREGITFRQIPYEVKVT